MPSGDILDSLTEAQRAAVTHVDGPLLILAGPGSGKTRVIVHRIAHMLHQGVLPQRILALTFTNKAADEMKARLKGLAPGRNVWMGTFHRFCARLLRRQAALVGLKENYTIYDTRDSLAALKLSIQDENVHLEKYTPQRIAQTISWTKNHLITSDSYVARPGDPLGRIMEVIYPAYQQRLLDANAVDFDDLLLHVATLLRENEELRRDLDQQYRYILVDEYQDTNLAQYAIVRALSINHPNLAVTGDPDQSIYGWRGANLDNILEFEKDYPKVAVVRLEQNYRSTKRILRVADALITNNVKRKEKTLYTENEDGEAVRLVMYATHKDEAETIATRIAADVNTGRRRPRDFAIFYRVNALSRTFEHSLAEAGVPYQIVGSVEFYQRKEIKDIIGYLQLLNNPADDVAFLRIVNTPPRRIGKTTINRLLDHGRTYRCSLLDAARECGMIETIAKRIAVHVAKFVALFDRLGEKAHTSLEELLGHVLTESGYREWLIKSDTPEDDERLANIEELLTVAREFDERHPDVGDGGLELFLEEASLVNDTDNWEEVSDKVTLMTLHAAKGLEFPVVHIVATEEGLLPHERSKEHPDQLEEERRLLFVGITRAEEELDISMALKREFRGSRRSTVASSFMMELPRDEMEVIQPRSRSTAAYAPSGVDDDEFAFAEEADEFNFGAIYDRLEQVGAERAGAEVEPREPTTPSPLKTAAQLLDAKAEEKPPALDPEVFELAMVVMHPEYGPGKIVALSGTPEKRMATVQFAGGAGEKKFRLAHSPLRPVGAK